MTLNNIDSLYLADKIYQHIDLEILPPELQNALIFQTFIVKRVSKNEPGWLSKINYPAEIVFALFSNSSYPLIKDLALLVSTYLDFYSLNNVLPLVKKSCAQVSKAIIDSKNSIKVLNAEGNHLDLDGLDANTFLWNTFFKNLYPILKTNPTSFDTTEWKVKVFEVAAIYLQCRGVDPSYTKKYFEEDPSIHIKSPSEIASLLNFRGHKVFYDKLCKQFYFENKLKDNSLNNDEEKSLEEECNIQKYCQDLPPGFTLFPIEEFEDDEDSIANLLTQSWLNSPILANTPPRTPVYDAPDSDNDGVDQKPDAKLN